MKGEKSQFESTPTEIGGGYFDDAPQQVVEV